MSGHTTLGCGDNFSLTLALTRHFCGMTSERAVFEMAFIELKER